MVSSIVSSLLTSSLLMISVMTILWIDRDGDLLRHHWRIVRDVRAVCENHLQAVIARRQLHRNFGLAAAEMPVLLVHWDRHAGGRCIGVDDQMVMAGVHIGGTCGRHPHTRESKLDQHRALYVL